MSFELLINEVEEISQNAKHPMQVMTDALIIKLDKIPELKEAVCPGIVLENHSELVKQLMAFVINPLNDTSEIAAVTPPFSLIHFHTTNLFDKKIGNNTKKLKMAKDSGQDMTLISMIYHA